MEDKRKIESRVRYRTIKDRAAKNIMPTLTILSILLLVIIGIGLYVKSAPILREKSLWTLLSESQWKPLKGDFGFFPFLMSTLAVTGIAIAWALPVSLLNAILLTENSRPYAKRLVFPTLDILAGIPSVVYGVWGVLIIVPWISDKLAPRFVEFSTGYTVLAGGVVLGIMILPMLISLFVELFSSVPRELREASLSLGATKWQTTKFVVLKKTLPGIFAAVILAISRAMGETIAVLMVCGNIIQAPKSLFEGCYPLPALIANNYGEMLSLPMYESALMFAALILFTVVLLFNFVSRIIMNRIEKSFT